MVAALVAAVWIWSGLGSSPSGESLADAVAAGDTGLAQELLEQGADPEEPRVSNLTPLMRAASRNDAAMIRLLVEMGADPGTLGDAGLTAVHIAAQRDSVGAFELLLNLGGEVHHRSFNGMDALDHAADWGSLGVIRELAALGVDLDARSEVVTQGHGYPRDEGPTALAIAVRAGRMQAARLLLDLGAGVDAPSARGHTPLLVAIFSGQEPEIIRLLLDAGADPGVRVACEAACSPGDSIDLDALGWAERLERVEAIPLLRAATNSS